MITFIFPVKSSTVRMIFLFFVILLSETIPIKETFCLFPASLLMEIKFVSSGLSCKKFFISENRFLKWFVKSATVYFLLIAGNIETPRKIEGFLVRLASEAILKKSIITPDLIESIIGKGSEPNNKNIKANPVDVINALSKYFSLGKRSLMGSSRARPVARPRQILMYLLRTELGLPLEEVGRVVGGRDHTTVMHAVEKISHLASENVQIREDIRGIKNMF